MDNCEYCGTRIYDTDRSCPSCGGTIKSVFQEEIYPKNKFHMDSDFPYKNVIGLAVNNYVEVVRVGEFLFLNVFAIEKEGAPHKIPLSDLDIFSNDEKIAKVSQNGEISFIRNGKVTIRGNISGKPFMDFSCDIMVV